jgi:hypothetical protein
MLSAITILKTIVMSTAMNRRFFVKGTLLSSASLAMGLPARGQNAAPAASPPTTSPEGFPKAKIGKLEVSRLILGGNLLTHYTHSRDLKYVYNLAAHYNTDEKIMETLALAEKHGINTVSMHNPPHPMSVLSRYRKERGGKIQWIICPTAQIDPDLVFYRRDVEDLLKDGCEALYVWGVHTDAMVPKGKVDLIAKAVDLMRSYGVPAGVGAHSLESVKVCEKHGVKADFYIKTFHHHKYPSGPKPEQIQGPYNEYPGYWCAEPEATAEYMKSIAKPWIAFKVMAAGAIPPKDAFPYVYQNGADCILAGMFDFEIAEDVEVARKAYAGVKDRVRPWRA